MSAVLRMRPENKIDECFLVELQGTFELSKEELKARNGDNRQGLELGLFRVKEDLKKAEIQMGSNTLIGKIEHLPKPMLIVRKTGRKEYLLRPPGGKEVLVGDLTTAASGAGTSTAIRPSVLPGGSSGNPNEGTGDVVMQTSATAAAAASSTSQFAASFQQIKNHEDVGGKKVEFGNFGVSNPTAADNAISNVAKPLAKNLQIRQPSNIDCVSEILEVEAVIRKKAIFNTRPSIYVPPELVVPDKDWHMKKGKKK
ncbi:unnamed protein product [Amoebophrya sp. A120]|nr:unnamed protein product [Amoebophrya sp. A120]|eukprot:GSA120T00018707001.1